MKKTFIIAELSANHNHNLQVAVDSIKAAAQIGVDAVKIQTYTADSLTLNCDKEDFMIRGGLWDGYNLYKLYEEAFTPWEWHEELFRVAKEEGIVLFSTPFDKKAVDFLETLGNPIYKIASFEIVDYELIRYAASKGKPMIMSTGIATEEEIDLAVKTCRDTGNNDITLLKCTSAYPARIEDANLNQIPAMREKFGVKTGLSDHSMGSLLPVLSVALGGQVVEKHFILDRNIGGPDAAFSMDRDEFAKLVKDIRETEAALGSGSFQNDTSEIKGREFARSLYVSRDIKEGEVITEDNIRCVRPGFGLHPRHYREVIGKKAKKNLFTGDRLAFQDIE